jgi:hypothetical protein
VPLCIYDYIYTYIIYLCLPPTPYSHVCVCVCVCVVCVCVCACACACVCIYIYIYIYIYIMRIFYLCMSGCIHNVYSLPLYAKPPPTPIRPSTLMPLTRGRDMKSCSSPSPVLGQFSECSVMFSL